MLFLVGGDFNSVLRVEDRFQGNPITEGDIKDFSDCLQANALTPIRMIGSDFTWCNNQEGEKNRIYSLIDRSVANSQWFSEYANVIVEILEKGISDHCPQLLNLSSAQIQRTSPFKFLNVLADHPDFRSIIQENWGIQGHGNKLLNIWYSLKKLQQPLKHLNAHQFKNIPARINDIRVHLMDTQTKLTRDKLNFSLINEERKLLAELEKWSSIGERIWHQKSRADWIKLGDSNTKFFHAFTKARQSGNAIKLLIREDGTRCLNQAQIKEEVRSFYISLMGSAASSLPMVDKTIVERGPVLSLEQHQQLCSSVTSQEIRDALFTMNPNKAPGMDGFNAFFFQHNWNVIGEDIVAAAQDFFVTGFLPKKINTTLIALLPKTTNASTIREFRPIACCSILYKIISKTLANRLQTVLDSVINESQSAFLKGRVIFDNILLSHELIKGYNMKNVSPRCMVKIDLQKAYDSVEWPFIKQLMLEMGFPYLFVRWIMACLSSVSYSVYVNGELTEPFEAKKGLRQGDPISPYLFVLSMEYLHRCLMSLKTEKGFHYHPRCKKFNLTHVCFADDLLLFSRGDISSVKQLMKAFQLFSDASGLKANQAKCNVYFGGVSEAAQGAILDEFGMTKGEHPFKYLGVPLSSKKLSIIQCQPLIKKILARIECWSSKFLSYAGRLQLIRSVLFSIQMYWCQVFLLPQKVVKVIQSACRVFLWTGKAEASKRSLVAWEQICAPKEAGGWNITNVQIWNKAALSKLLWCLAQKKDKLWVHGYYVKNHSITTMPVPARASWEQRSF